MRGNKPIPLRLARSPNNAQAGRPLRGVACYPEGHRAHPPAAAGSMPHPHRRRHRGPKPDRRRALELLVVSPNGCTEALMLANGFPVEMLVELIRNGLASAVARVRITEAGRREHT
jgi:hypothetical protein